MSTFPQLKTGAVAQYPASRGLRFQNQVLRFLDGAEQRYRDSAGPLHAWEIQLAALDESEIAALEQFVLDTQGAFGSFTFTDPWDGKTYTNCSLATDEISLTSVKETDGKTSLKIIETRG